MLLMTRRQWLQLAGGSLLSAQAPKLNFVLIVVDDLGWADLGCQGSEFYETPNIDRLANEGIRFTDGYAASPVCSPSRAAIMTGRYPGWTGITNYLPGHHPLPFSKMIGPLCKQYLDPAEVTLAEALKSAGYRTAHIGKWHLGGSPEYWPEAQGFDLNIGGTNSGMPKSFFWPQWKGNPPIEGLRDGEYLTDRLTTEAIQFIRSSRDQPFFLHLSHYAVHVPIEAKAEKVERYRAKLHPGSGQNDPVYAAMIESLDEGVGRILKTLEEQTLMDRTVIVFTADNGGLSAPEWKGKPVTSNAPLREGKGHLYEGGIRVPFLVRWPGVSPRADHTPVCGIDIFPTFCRAAGVNPRQVHGVDLEPLIRRRQLLPHRALYWHYPHYSNQLGKPAGAVRDGPFKLLEFYEDGKLELYNLHQDPGEQKDLAPSMPAKARELHAKLIRWRQSIPGLQMPQPNPKYDPERADQGYWWQTRERP
jgi:arylsulfatase A